MLIVKGVGLSGIKVSRIMENLFVFKFLNFFYNEVYKRIVEKMVD